MTRSFLLILFSLFACSDSGSKNISDESIIQDLEWNEVWSDEFDGESLDENKWNILQWRPGWVNNELQAYTSRDTNVFIDNGNLVLQGLIEPGYYGTDHTGTGYNADYTSGRVNTDDKINWTYGRFDIRAKLPKGRGSWPAIWMLGENLSLIHI